MKKYPTGGGIAGWRIDHPIEKMLAKAADRGETGKSLYVWFYRLFDRKYYKKGLTLIDRTLKDFGYDFQGKTKKKYVSDMVYSLHRFGCPFDEYFLFDFPHLNACGRDEFVTDKKCWDYSDRMNLEENRILFNDKKKTSEIFGSYYGREVMDIKSEADKDTFLSFAGRHRRFIVKPYDGSCGKGITVEECANADEAKKLFDRLLKRGRVVVEQLIRQAKEMASLHAGSVNTVRIPTVKTKDEVIIFEAALRMGVGDSVVDNAGSGGIFAAVDVKTGVCKTVGVDEKGHSYVCHPDTGIVIPGFRIPRWEEAVRLAKELSHVVEKNNYCGWDLALTDEGWVMIEGNPRGQFAIQYATKKGMKRELEEYISRM